MTDTERLVRIEGKVDRLDARFSTFQLRVEHRVTKLEGRASLFGLLGGMIVVLTAILLRQL